MPGSISICTPRALAFLWQELRIGKARADHQQRVAVDHHLPAWLGAQQPDRSGDPRQIVWHRAFAQQSFRHAGAETFRHRDHLIRGTQSARAYQDRDALARIQHFSCPAQISVVRHNFRCGIANAGMHRAVLARRRCVGLFLQIVGHHQGGHRRSPTAMRTARSTRCRTCAGMLA